MAKNKHASSDKHTDRGAKSATSAKSAAQSDAKSPSKRGAKTSQPKWTLENGSHPAATLKDRVEQAAADSEPKLTPAESEAVRIAISVPGLLDEVREEAFVELGAVVQRMLATHEVHLAQTEAANVAWWIVSHPDDVPDA